MNDNIRELTLRGMILGAIITIIFTASNVYLGLKVGLTFSSSIPAAVISMAVLRFFSGSTILENNMVQTQASAAGTLSSIMFALPGLLILGYWQGFPFLLTFSVCATGGILGVLFSIPLRHAMVVKSNLPYPEGVAAAEILKIGVNNDNNDETEQDAHKNGLKDIIFGGATAALVSFMASGLRIITDSTAYWFTQGRAIFQLPVGFSLALLSAGYLIGAASGVAILIGAIIAWGGAVPILSSMSDYSSDATLNSVGMGLWASKIRFIGAGTLGIASIWTLITLIKPVVEGLKSSLRTLKSDNHIKNISRTEQDLSPKTILIIMVISVLILGLTFHGFIAQSGLSSLTAWSLVAIVVILSFFIGFLVSAACGYMAGLVGSSASPISGIGIIAAIIVSLVLLGMSEVDGLLATPQGTQFATALTLFTTSAVIAIAAIANDNLQDLKTGFLVKATPWRQQVALLIGCVVGATVISPVLDLLYQAYGFPGAMPREGMDINQTLAAPQATLIASIAKGIFSHNLEWSMIQVGLVIGAIIIIIDFILSKMNVPFRLPALAVGMGIYLPPTITTPIILGSFISWFIKIQAKKRATQAGLNPTSSYKNVDRKASLIAAGLIVGESLIGVTIAVIIVISSNDAPLNITNWLSSIFGNSTGLIQQLLGLAVFILVCIAFIRRSLSIIKRH